MSFCYGRVQLNIKPSSCHMGPNTRLASPEEIDETWVHKINFFLDANSEHFDKLCEGLDALRPFVSDIQKGHGCSSGHDYYVPGKPKTAYITINDLHGCAQGLYHESGHLFLETQGIYIEHHDQRLLLNTVDELYNSSVRFDKKRPMSAVLHGVYAWLMFTENDFQLFKAGRISLDEFRSYSAHNLPKITKGIAEIQQYARWTPEGLAFIRPIYDWAFALVTEAGAALSVDSAI